MSCMNLDVEENTACSGRWERKSINIHLHFVILKQGVHSPLTLDHIRSNCDSVVLSFNSHSSMLRLWDQSMGGGGGDRYFRTLGGGF